MRKFMDWLKFYLTIYDLINVKTTLTNAAIFEFLSALLSCRAKYSAVEIKVEQMLLAEGKSKSSCFEVKAWSESVYPTFCMNNLFCYETLAYKCNSHAPMLILNLTNIIIKNIQFMVFIIYIYIYNILHIYKKRSIIFILFYMTNCSYKKRSH